MKGQTPGSSPSLPDIALAGAFAGVILSFVLGPVELIKVCWMCLFQFIGFCNWDWCCANAYSGCWKLCGFYAMQCRLQAQSGRKLAGPIQCASHLLKTEGPLGITRGLGACMAREIPGNSIFFTTYEMLQQRILGRNPVRENNGGIFAIAANAASAILCGGVAGTMVRLCCQVSHCDPSCWCRVAES